MDINFMQRFPSLMYLGLMQVSSAFQVSDALVRAVQNNLSTQHITDHLLWPGSMLQLWIHNPYVD